MKLIIPWYKLIAQAFKHQDLENVLLKGSLCTILKMRLFFFFFFKIFNKVHQILHGFLEFKET